MSVYEDPYSLKNTTKQQRIELIRSWSNNEDDGPEGCEIDLWDMYADYISGTKEIAECNAAFRPDYYTEPEDEPAPSVRKAVRPCRDAGFGNRRTPE